MAESDVAPHNLEADALRMREAAAITDEAAKEAERRELEAPPVPCAGLKTLSEMLRARDRCAFAQAPAVRRSEDWERLSAAERAVCAEWLTTGVAASWRVVVSEHLGRTGRGGWRDAPLPAAEVVDMDAPDTLADLPEVETVPVVAQDLWYRGKVALLHGPSGSGKTTFSALAAAAVTTGRPFTDLPTIAGEVIVCTEDPESWRTVVHGAGGDLARVKLRSWRDLPEAVRKLRPVAVAVDTMQFVAHQNGSGELDSAREVDAILRPLEALARETGAAVAILDHEPWSDGRRGDAETGTQARPRHSGAKVATCDAVLRVTCDKDDADRITTITVRPSKAKGARRGIEISTLTVDLKTGGTTPGRGGGDGGGVEVDEFARYRDREDDVRSYLMENPSASARSVRLTLKLKGRASVAAAFVETIRPPVPAFPTPPPGTRERGGVPGVPANGNAPVPAFPPYKGTAVPGTDREREHGNGSDAQTWSCSACGRKSRGLPCDGCGHIPGWATETDLDRHGLINRRAAVKRPGPAPALAVGKCELCHKQGPVIPGDPVLDTADMCPRCAEKSSNMFAYAYRTGDFSALGRYGVQGERREDGGLDVRFVGPTVH